MLNEIVEPRAHELLSLVRDEWPRRGGFAANIPAGLVLCGGGAHLKGLVELAERMFNFPVRLAKPRGLEGMPEEAFPAGVRNSGWFAAVWRAQARRQAAPEAGKFRG